MYRHKTATVFLLSCFIFAGCQPVASSESPTATIIINPMIQIPTATSQESTQTPTQDVGSEPLIEFPSTSTAIPEPEMEVTNEISDVLISVDGLEMAGTFYTPKDQPPPWPGAILLHMLWGNRSSWDEFALKLADAGYAVLNVDMRGHGETGGEVDWDLAAEDLQQVWSNLAARPDVDQDRTAFIGASIGANMALVASANESSVRTAILLSPGLNYAGVKTEAAMQSYGERPVIIVASQEDTYAANSSVTLEAETLGESQLIMYEDAGHGIFMFQGEPDLSQLIIEWLDRYLQ